jgi:hypothetical protein
MLTHNLTNRIYQDIIAMIGMALMLGAITTSSRADFLYVGDAGDNTIKRFNAKTGVYHGIFVLQHSSDPQNSSDPPSTSPDGSGEAIIGPRGLIFNHDGDLLLANQNANQIANGTIIRYDGKTGAFLGDVVDYTDADSPVAPRGIVLLGERLFVASDGGEGPLNSGKLRAYTKDGQFIGELLPPNGDYSHFRPRAVVIGPDGLLYVSNAPNPPQPGPIGPPSLGGQILRYDPKTLAFLDVFTSDNAVEKHDFNRPEGLVFGPDGNLYVTSFVPNQFGPTGNATDKILVFAGPWSEQPGTLIDHIDLDQPSNIPQERAAAQALLFGPEGFLYVPISGPVMGPDQLASDSVGEIRRYNVHSKKYDLLVTAFRNGGRLLAGWYLTFGKTDPATLAYRRQGEDEREDDE